MFHYMTRAYCHSPSFEPSSSSSFFFSSLVSSLACPLSEPFLLQWHVLGSARVHRAALARSAEPAARPCVHQWHNCCNSSSSSSRFVAFLPPCRHDCLSRRRRGQTVLPVERERAFLPSFLLILLIFLLVAFFSFLCNGNVSVFVSAVGSTSTYTIFLRHFSSLFASLSFLHFDYVASFFIYLCFLFLGSCHSFASLFPGYPVVICGKHRGEGDQRVVVIQDGDPSPAKHVLIVDDLVQSGGTLFVK